VSDETQRGDAITTRCAKPFPQAQQHFRFRNTGDFDLMARPRTPAAVLELRGSFRKDPQRRRIDAEGNRPLNPRRPRHLPPECGPAWTQIVRSMPRISTFDCDGIAIETAARLLTTWRSTGDLRTARELRAWLVVLGFSPRARTHLAALAPERTGSRFAQFVGCDISDNPFDRFCCVAVIFCCARRRIDPSGSAPRRQR
jgi:hypothetical protein